MELKPCPFCTGIAELVVPKFILEEPKFVRCNTCGARGPEKFTRVGAINLWNNRRTVEASRTPHKWPTEDEIEQAEIKESMEPWSNQKVAKYAFRCGINWLKSFVEKDKSE